NAAAGESGMPGVRWSLTERLLRAGAELGDRSPDARVHGAGLRAEQAPELGEGHRGAKAEPEHVARVAVERGEFAFDPREALGRVALVRGVVMTPTVRGRVLAGGAAGRAPGGVARGGEHREPQPRVELRGVGAGRGRTDETGP